MVASIRGSAPLRALARTVAATMVTAGVFLVWVARKAKTTPAEGLAPFVVSVGFLGGLVALIGVIWQALPTVIGAA